MNNQFLLNAILWTICPYYYRNHHWALLVLINILLLSCQFGFLSHIQRVKKSSWVSCKKLWEYVWVLQVPSSLFLPPAIKAADSPSSKHIICAIMKWMSMFLSPLKVEHFARQEQSIAVGLWWNNKLEHVWVIGVSLVQYVIIRPIF